MLSGVLIPWDRVQTGLKLWDRPAAASQVPGLKAYITTTTQLYNILMGYIKKRKESKDLGIFVVLTETPQPSFYIKIWMLGFEAPWSRQRLCHF